MHAHRKDGGNWDSEKLRDACSQPVNAHGNASLSSRSETSPTPIPNVEIPLTFPSPLIGFNFSGLFFPHCSVPPGADRDEVTIRTGSRL